MLQEMSGLRDLNTLSKFKHIELYSPCSSILPNCLKAHLKKYSDFQGFQSTLEARHALICAPKASL